MTTWGCLLLLLLITCILSGVSFGAHCDINDKENAALKQLTLGTGLVLAVVAFIILLALIVGAFL